MERVGIRELKHRTSEILRKVREGKKSFEITHRGRVVASLRPVKEQTRLRSEALSVWAEMDELAEEIGRRRTDGLSAKDAVREQRREL